MENSYSTMRLSGWKEFKAFVDELSENWAFRGQVNARWPLKNAIERTDFIHLNDRIEADFLSEFQRGARNYLHRDEIPGHIIEWLALMQHHGAPTRLLDFSKSPYIAAYFAFEQCSANPDHHAAVWAINIRYLRDRALEVLENDFAEELQATHNLINEPLFEKIFHQNNRSLVFPVEPFRMNRRYSLQQSLFVSTGISAEPFMKQLDFLGSDISRSVIKMEIPAASQKEVMRDLLRMNLNRASIFPDLDGYAASLKLRYDSLKTPEEVQRLEAEKLKDRNFDFIP